MDRGLVFEHTMRLFFGSKAHQIAGAENSKGERRRWIEKCSRLLVREINRWDTSPEHKRALMTHVERFAKTLPASGEPTWEMVYGLLRLAGGLSGFCDGAHCQTPVYHRTSAQYYTNALMRGGDPMRDYYDKRDAISARAEVIEHLQKLGFDTFKIALILNTTEYEVKKLRAPASLRKSSSGVRPPRR